MRVIRRGARRRICAALLPLGIALTAVNPSFAQPDQWGYWENGVTESWWLSSDDFTAAEAAAAVARWKEIGAASPQADGWPGDYFRGGETHGTYLRWSPQAGFIIVPVDKCQARVMGVIYGRAEASPPFVRFSTEFSKSSKSGSHGHAHAGAHAPAVIKFVPVQWRGDRLLVAEEEMDDFGDFVAGLGDYNYSAFDFLEYAHFFVRSRGAGGGAGSERPVVPAGYERFLKRPIEAEITSVGRRVVRRNYSYKTDRSEEWYGRASLTFVTVSAGSARGLKAGMFLRVADPDDGDRVRILRAGRNTSTGVVIRSLDESGRETFFEGGARRFQLKVSPGWKLTTAPL